MEQAAKKPGRPAKYSTPMTSTQRGQESRERAFQAMLTASEDLQNASLKAILGNLELQIGRISTDPENADTWRDISARLMGELCQRHKIQMK